MIGKRQSPSCQVEKQGSSVLKCAQVCSSLITQVCSSLDAQMSLEAEGVRVLLGSVTRRPAEETRAELERACRHDRQVIATPIPRPPSGAPARFWVAQRPPLPTPPPRHTADVGPDIPDSERRVRAAAISARAREATEEYLRPLLEEAASASAAPKRGSPPREVDDHYDLAKWGRRYSRWN